MHVFEALPTIMVRDENSGSVGEVVIIRQQRWSEHVLHMTNHCLPQRAVFAGV